MGERLVAECGLVRELVSDGMTVADVGANIGYHLLMFEQLVGQRGHIICVEPGVENLRELTRNLRANRLENVTVLPVAAGANAGTVTFREGLNGQVTSAPGSGREVRVVRLDDVIERRVDFVKIDVEGYEAHVLDGAQVLLHRYRPIVFLELHPFLLPRFGSSIEQITGSLGQLYPHIEAWSAGAPSGLAAKVRSRYAGRQAVQRVDLEELVSGSAAWQGDRTCWLIARP